MTHKARVVSVVQGHPPNVDWRNYQSSLAVTVADADDKWQVFWVMADGQIPPVGAQVEYGPHECWWDGGRCNKTTTRDP